MKYFWAAIVGINLALFAIALSYADWFGAFVAAYLAAYGWDRVERAQKN